MRSLPVRIISLFTLLLVFSWGWDTVSTARANTPAYTLTLSKDLASRTPAEDFDCRERIYLITNWFHVSGAHRVTAQWYNPEGALQDEGHLDFEARSQETSGWLGLEFLNVEDPGSQRLNAEVARFYGRWKVRVFLDHRLLEEREFFVRCK